MGKIVSDIASDIESVAESVSKLVTDAATAVEQLGQITGGFAGKPPVPYAATQADASDVPTALKNAMTAAKKAAAKAFKKQWPGVDPAGSDDGVVQDYVSGGSVQCAIDQMTQDFEDWQIDADSKTAKEMANTIASQIQAQMGAAGTAQGHHSLNMNQQIDWTVAYGLFAMGGGKQGLVYAYTAALDGGF